MVASDSQDAVPVSEDVDVVKPGSAPDADPKTEPKNEVTTEPAPRSEVQSDRAEVDAQASFVAALSREDKTGIAYFLPRQLAKVTAKRSETTLADAIKSLGQAELALSVAKAKQTSAAAAVKDTEEAIISNSGTEVVLNILKPRLAEQKESLKRRRKTSEPKKKLCLPLRLRW